MWSVKWIFLYKSVCVRVCVRVWCRELVSVLAQQQGARGWGGAAGSIQEPPQRQAYSTSISPWWQLSCGVKAELELPYCLQDHHHHQQQQQPGRVRQNEEKCGETAQFCSFAQVLMHVKNRNKLAKINKALSFKIHKRKLSTGRKPLT